MSFIEKTGNYTLTKRRPIVILFEIHRTYQKRKLFGCSFFLYNAPKMAYKIILDIMCNNIKIY